MAVEHAELRCEHCRMVTDHELRYAGRLLESTRCTRCGRHIVLTQRALVPAYVHDLELRLLSKPRRMWRRTRQDPAYLLRVPRAALRQPAKFVREFWSLVRR